MLVVGLALGSVLNGRAATLTWTGGGNGGNSSDWSAKQNWGYSTPDSTDSVIFTSSVGNSSTPTLSNDSSVNSITFASGAAAFTIGGAYTLTVRAGGIVNNGATTQILSVRTVGIGGSQTWNAASGSLSLTGAV